MLLDFGVEGCRTPSEVCGMPPRVGGRCPTQPLSVQTGAFSTRLVLCPPFQVRPAHPGKPWHESCGFCKKWPQTWCFQVTEIYSLAFFRGQESKIKAQAGLIAPPPPKAPGENPSCLLHFLGSWCPWLGATSLSLHLCLHVTSSLCFPSVCLPCRHLPLELESIWIIQSESHPEVFNLITSAKILQRSHSLEVRDLDIVWGGAPSALFLNLI